jgi:hypothetical protein
MRESPGDDLFERIGEIKADIKNIKEAQDVIFKKLDKLLLKIDENHEKNDKRLDSLEHFRTSLIALGAVVSFLGSLIIAKLKNWI